MMKKFFDEPTQVSFCVDNETMKENGRKCWFGIAYHDIIICGCCGGIIEIEECEQIIEYEDWLSIEAAIGVEDYFNSLPED